MAVYYKMYLWSEQNKALKESLMTLQELAVAAGVTAAAVASPAAF
jgi:hypothetical protein